MDFYVTVFVLRIGQTMEMRLSQQRSHLYENTANSIKIKISVNFGL